MEGKNKVLKSKLGVGKNTLEKNRNFETLKIINGPLLVNY